MSSWIKSVVLSNISLNYISCPDCLPRSFSCRAYRFASCFQSYMNIACSHGTQNAACKKIIWCFRSKMQAKMILRPLPTSVHSNTRKLALQVWRLAKLIQKRLGGRVFLEIELQYDFSKVFFQSYLLPYLLYSNGMN